MENASISSGSELNNLKDQIEEGIRQGKYTWTDIQQTLVTKTREAATTTDIYVHDNPWKVVGIAAALGLVLGLLIAPRSGD